MAYRDYRLVWGGLIALGSCLGARAATAQTPPAASFPADPAPVATAPPPPPAAPPPPAPPPTAAPAPTLAPPAAAPPAATGPTPAPATAPAPPSQPYAANPNAQPGYGASYGEPPPPPPAPPEDEKSPIPPFSVRVDPFNWILEGQLGFELEVGLTKWLSVETVPVFVVDETPPWMNFGGGDSRVYQRSNGWGALSGASIGANFWPNKLFKGYVIRTGLNNYALSYETRNDVGTVDSLSHTKRQFYAMLGSVSRWGAFTIGGGIGLGYDLNKTSRCIDTSTPVFDPSDAKPGNCDELQIAVPIGTNTVTPVAVSPFTYPWEFLARISLGVIID